MVTCNLYIAEGTWGGDILYVLGNGYGGTIPHPRSLLQSTDRLGIGFRKGDGKVSIFSFFQHEDSTYSVSYEEKPRGEMPISSPEEDIKKRCLELLVNERLKQHLDYNLKFGIDNKVWLHKRGDGEKEWTEFDPQPYLSL